MMAKSYIIMGVSGSGKTTVGTLLAKELGLPFHDADSFHPKANIDKMTSGIPLNDNDRLPWLEALRTAVSSWERGGVLACSALKESYRKLLSQGNDIEWIYLEGDFDLIEQRMAARKHYMKPEMLRSQFNDLEPPSYGIHVHISKDPMSLVSELAAKIKQVGTSQLGIVGMGVMGRSLAKNALSKGYAVSVFNRYTEAEKEVVPKLLESVNDKKLKGYTSLLDFISSLEVPRKILLMIPAGAPVDSMINEIAPHLEASDLLMDGGNSHYSDTQRREMELNERGIHYLGIGISGGESGALNGPSLMVGGSPEAYKNSKVLLDDIAAKDLHNNPCSANLGPNGAGHFIKTIHNGIEYGEMQLLAEIYALLSPSLSNDEIASLMEAWNADEQSGFLLETTISILRKKEGNHYLLDKVLDKAAGKGTGTWSGISALESGVPASVMIAAVMARSLSNAKEQRTALSNRLEITPFAATVNSEALKQAYQFSRIINHCQGLKLISEKSAAENWGVDLAEVVRVWTNGCILRSELLTTFIPLLKEEKELIAHSHIYNVLRNAEPAMAEIVLVGMEQRTPLPCISSALQFWYGITTKDSSANLIQAQRDSFGAHTYQRTDRPLSESFTTNWNSNG